VLAALNHPNIAQIYGLEQRALVMELVEGETLKGPLTLETALNYAKQIADALEAAHEKGITHRDLKPGNILIAANGAKLLDFGLAKLMADAEATQTIGVSGTPLYMSPEQAEGKALDARSDVFSFGAVLYEVLSGHRAFDSLAAMLRDDPLEASGDLVQRLCLVIAPRVIGGPQHACHGALQHESPHPVRIGRSEQCAHRAALR